MVAAVASEEPQMAPKPAQAPIDAMAIPPPAMAEEGADEVEQLPAQATMGGELAYQQEQRDHHQVVIGKAGIGERLEGVEQHQRLAVGEIQIAAGTAHEHDDADGDAQRQQGKQDAEDDEADTGAAHGFIPRRVQVCAHM